MFCLLFFGVFFKYIAAEHSAHMTQSLKTLSSVSVVVVKEKPFHNKPLCEISSLSVIAFSVSGFQLETGNSQPNLSS